jgi:hypothetical protein
MTEEKKRREEKEETNCHMLITSLLNEGAVIKIRVGRILIFGPNMNIFKKGKFQIFAFEYPIF